MFPSCVVGSCSKISEAEFAYLLGGVALPGVGRRWWVPLAPPVPMCEHGHSSIHGEVTGMGHRKLLKRFHEPGQLHEFTFSSYQRRELLLQDSWLKLLAGTLTSACREEQIDLVAFVFMPEHLHLLVNPLTEEPKLGRFLARIKQPFSSQIREQLELENPQLVRELTVQERPGKTCFRFWQEGAGYDRNIETEEALHASINYIHNNPCRRGLCERAIDWKWSSARYYLLDPPGQQFPDLPFVHGLRERPLITPPSGTGGASGTHLR